MTNTNSGNSGDESSRKPVEPRQARGRQDAIGVRLRMMYDKVVDEDVPSDFLAFLEQADDRASGSGAPDPSGPDPSEPSADGKRSGD